MDNAHVKLNLALLDDKDIKLYQPLDALEDQYQRI